MKPPITTTCLVQHRHERLLKPPVGFLEERRGLRVTAIRDDDAARIEMRGVHAARGEMRGDDQAGKTLAVGGNRIGRARRQLAHHGQAAHQSVQFLEMGLDDIFYVQAGRFAQMKLAQVVQLVQRGFQLAGNRIRGDRQ